MTAKKTKEVTSVVAYKGFDKNLQCRGYQYEVGKEYVHKGHVSPCSGGFHACESPLAVLSYYGVKSGNRFALVEVAGKIEREQDKLASERITIKAEIGIPSLIKAAVAWTRKAASAPTSGDSAHSATSGYSAHSATSGDYANSATSGYYANSEAKGKNAVAANAGNGRARAGEGGAIFLVERDRSLNILAVFASKVGENGIKADTWYELKGGAPKEVTA